MMRLFLSLVIIVTVGISVSLSAADNPQPDFYVQIVRGANDTKAKDPSWKPIGPKLSQRLKRVVPWNYYWETTQLEVESSKGKSRTLEISPGRKVEIVYTGNHQVDLCMYRNGALRRKSRVAVNSGMTIMGGETSESESWFVVVRNDKPSVH